VKLRVNVINFASRGRLLGPNCWHYAAYTVVMIMAHLKLLHTYVAYMPVGSAALGIST